MPTPPTPAPNIPTLLTAEDVARRTGLTLRNVRDVMYSRSLPTVKIGRRVYVRESDLAAWIDAHAREGVR